jgi:hypothetical protein
MAEGAGLGVSYQKYPPDPPPDWFLWLIGLLAAVLALAVFVVLIAVRS